MDRFDIFAQYPISELLQAKQDVVRTFVFNELENTILNVNEQDYQNYLIQTATIEGLFINFDGFYIDQEERNITGPSWNRQLFIICHFPFDGNDHLFAYNPLNNNNPWTRPIYFCPKDSKCICLEFKPEMENFETIRKDIEIYKKNIQKISENLAFAVKNHNQALPQFVKEVFNYRKQTLLKRYQMLASIGVPLRKNENLPETYAIPTPQLLKPIQIKKPVVTEVGYTPEPTLEDTTYNEILQIIHDMGKVLERLTLILRYMDTKKAENIVRDLFLLYLTPRFSYDNAVVGETFNGAGKTDILLRYQNTNVFVAECKFWGGPKDLSDAITQLLTYLTWRDSKAAVIMFTRETAITTVLRGIEEHTKEHSNYVGFVSKKEESWFNYKFRTNKDPNRGVDLAVLAFDLIPARNSDSTNSTNEE